MKKHVLLVALAVASFYAAAKGFQPLGFSRGG